MYHPELGGFYVAAFAEGLVSNGTLKGQASLSLHSSYMYGCLIYQARKPVGNLRTPLFCVDIQWVIQSQPSLCFGGY